MSKFPLNKGNCALCKHEVESETVRWISDSPFCPNCINEFEKQELIKPGDNPRTFFLTEKGEQKFPGLKVVAYCIYDSMPIYQRWISAGIAEAGQKPTCPFCLGKSEQVVKVLM